MLTVWHAMSPRAPVPKSHQPRQAKVWYALSAYGRLGAGPNHWSQSRYDGTSAGEGRSIPWGQIGRLVQTWTSLTGPRIPALMSAADLRRPLLAVPWFPICV